MQKQTLLIVDDESDNLDALERIFRKRYHLLKANSGAEALQLISHHPDIAVIITDQRMPQMTGVEFLEKTLSSHPKTVRILLTGYTEIESIIAAVNQGHIFRYITKPWDTTDLTNSIEQAMEHYSRGSLLEEKNQALEKAFSELKLLDQAKSKFMILINHELKTPLTIINSFLSLLVETPLNEEQVMYTDRIRKSTLRLQEIIDDTLILTQHMAGKLDVKKQEVSLAELLRLSIEEFRGEAEKKNITFSDLLPTLSPSTRLVDPQLFRKIFRHLLGNAIRFSPHQSTILLEIKTSEKGTIFKIENEGTPIASSVIEKLETPFNLQAEIMNHSKGLGLGLSVSDAILQAHDSRLEISNLESPLEKTRVRISFVIP